MKIQIPQKLGLTHELRKNEERVTFFVRDPLCGSFKGVELTGTLPSFLASSKTITLIYQSFYFAITAKNAIFGSLLLRSAYNSDKLHFCAWFYDFPYTYPLHHMTRTRPDHGLHFERILGFWLYFCAISNKNAGKRKNVLTFVKMSVQ